MIRGGQQYKALVRVRRARGHAKIEAVREYVAPFTDHDCIGALVPLFEHEPHDVFWPCFALVWPRHWSNFKWNARLWSAMRRVGPHHSVQCLPETVVVYRGCSRSRIAGITWTTDPMTALGFALGHGDILVPNPCVAVAQIKRREAYWCSDNEHQVICLPAPSIIYSEEDLDWFEAMYDEDAPSAMRASIQNQEPRIVNPE
jgi:hypothetical protein